MLNVEKPVERPEDFYGRKNIVRRIYSRIASARPQSVAVIGGRKVGKSSLLAQLAQPSVREQHLDDPGRYRFVSLPLKDDPGQNAAAFLARLNDSLDVDRRPGESEYNRLQRRVEELHRAGVHLICFFDDFHHVTRNPNFPLEFFSFLRSLANNFNLAYVTSSHLELQKLCAAKDIEESPFFNIFTNIALGPLEAGEATALLRHLTGWDEAAAARIAAWAGPLPFALKLVARQCADGPPTEARCEKELLPPLKEYFSTILAVLPREAYKPLKDLVKGKPADPREAHFLKPLIRHHFLMDEEAAGGGIAFFSEAFRLFVQKHAVPELLTGNGQGS